MRTTIDIPDQLFRRAKKVAAEQGVALKEVVIRALRVHLDQPVAAAGYTFGWKVDDEAWNADLPLHSREALEAYLNSWQGNLYE